MTSAGNNHAEQNNWYGNELDGSQEVSSEPKQTGDERMYYPDVYMSKESRRRKIDRKRQEQFEDYVKERPVKRPRKNKIKRYDYNEWNE